MMAHPRHGLDPALQTPVRFSLLAALGTDRELDFATLRDFLETDDSSVSKAVTALESAGYVAVTKGYVGNRPRTWVRATAAGRRAFAAHVTALQAIAAAAVAD
ncbi:winged helix-turn-helix domain-containing protein [Microbacterium gorillae]|uniref:winged helix-turn-helix domain-containing protein n=1 Tax=Microbacterium gorillae TaxID=1231063 RepID=UPI000B9ACFE6|nr:transcriptional regulator [Microbacterium gorillae]